LQGCTSVPKRAAQTEVPSSQFSVDNSTAASITVLKKI